MDWCLRHGMLAEEKSDKHCMEVPKVPPRDSATPGGGVKRRAKGGEVMLLKDHIDWYLGSGIPPAGGGILRLWRSYILSSVAEDVFFARVVLLFLSRSSCGQMM